MDNQFLDYASWRKTNDKLLTYLINNKSLIIARFKYVIAVVDYLFDQVVHEKHTLDNNENEMFEVGYQYIFDRFMTINLLLEKVFNNNMDEMEKFSKEINLLLYIIDFEDEVDSLDGDHKKEHERFASLEDEIMQLIEHKHHIESEMFALVDDVSISVFDGLGVDYYGITDIFYDIAIDLELIHEEDDNYLDIDELLIN